MFRKETWTARANKCQVAKIFHVLWHHISKNINRITSTKCRSFCMTTFSADPTSLTVLLHQSRDCSSYITKLHFHRSHSINTLIYARTTSRTLSTCDISPGLLMLTAPEAGDLVEFILIYNEIGLEVNADKTKYMFKSQYKNGGRNHNKKTDNNSLEGLEQFKYLGTTLTNQNSIQEEIKSRSKSGNACYHSVQKLFSSSLLSTNIKVKIHPTIILPFVLYGCETWSLTLRKERRLRVFEKRVLRGNIWT